MSQKHFSHQSEIFGLIREANQKRDRLKLKIANLEEMRCAHQNAGSYQIAADFNKDIKALEKQVERIENGRIKKLRRTLAALQTEPMPFMDKNEVVMQKL